MIFHRTPIGGVFMVEGEPHADERGWFVRTFCAEEFIAHGIDARVAQTSMAFNAVSGTLRGMHYQAEPHGETKLVQCVAGRAFDAVADIRPGSPTYRSHLAVELSADCHIAVVVPPGVAHGYLTLTSDCVLAYQMSVPYVSDAATGVRWDDPDLAIAWPPGRPAVVALQDQALPLLTEIELSRADSR